MSAPIVSFANVTKRYGSYTALDDVSFAVPPGARLALLGHNGAGKTTLIKLALGLSTPSEGCVQVLGGDPASRRARGGDRMVGFVPESVAFHDAMTGRELLAFYARLKGEPAGVNASLLERVGLTAAANKRIKTYSKGMRQRLGLAQALLGRPKVLLLDEPTSGLDPAFRVSFYEIIDELVAQGSTVLFASHALNELAKHVDQAAILHQGRLVAHGSVAELGRAARLNSRIRIGVAPGRAFGLRAALNGHVAVARINDHSIELSCAPEEKLPLLQRLSALGTAIADIEIASPGLDEVFTYFTGRDARP